MSHDESDKHRATITIHGDLLGPHVVGWPCDYVYLLFAVARLQSNTGGNLALLALSRNLQTKTCADVSATVDDMIGQIEALTLEDVAPGNRITRLHTDKGTEYLGQAMKLRLETRQVYRTTTMGYDPKMKWISRTIRGTRQRTNAETASSCHGLQNMLANKQDKH